MNKMRKITMISVILMTSGFAQQQFSEIFFYDVTNKEIFEIGNGVTIDMFNNVTFHNYGTIQGPTEGTATINGTPNERIVNYNHMMIRNNALPDNYYSPNGGGKFEGMIDITNVSVVNEKADLNASLSVCNAPGDVMHLVTWCDEDEDKTLTLTNTDEKPITVNANIENEPFEDDMINMPHSLEINGKVKLLGNQSKFRQEGTSCNIFGENTVVDIANKDAFFQTPVYVNDGASLNITTSDVKISKNVDVIGSRFNVAKNGNFKLMKGAVLHFKAPKMLLILPADTVGLSNVDWDDESTWLLLERAGGMSSPLFMLRTNGNKVGIMEADLTDVSNKTLSHSDISSYENVAVKSLIKKSENGEYLGREDYAILKEIADQLNKGKRWASVADYKSNPFWAVSGTSSFATNTSLKDVVIPYGVTMIGQNAFYGCTGLERIDIPNSVKEIGMSAFKQANFASYNKMKNITIPASVETIGNYAFQNCVALETVKFSEPSSLKTIGIGAFYYCNNIESMVIPNSVTTIGKSAFYNNVKEITLPYSFKGRDISEIKRDLGLLGTAVVKFHTTPAAS